MDKIAEGRRVFDIEIQAMEKMRDALDDTFVEILDLVTNCKGKVVITGMGKPGHIGTKMAATFASLGTPSFFLHPGEAMHGDLGMVSSNDVVIAISYSGESDEIVRILPNIKMIGATLVGITGNANSTLAKESDIAQILPKFDEACYLGLAPTSSTTVELAYGDALAVVASGIYGFKEADFGKFHPAGALGKKLVLRVSDLMAKGDENAIIGVESMLSDAIVSLGKHPIGAVSVIDETGILKGIITDGDIRRLFEKGVNIYTTKTKDVMNCNPITIDGNSLAINAATIFKKKNIKMLAVTDKNGILLGAINVNDIIMAGLVF